MKYHEIGERFEYDGVVLEIADITDLKFPCKDCYFGDKNDSCVKSVCQSRERKDKKDVIYKLVEQSKTKDVEQKTEIKVEGTDKTIENIIAQLEARRKEIGNSATKQ